MLENNVVAAYRKSYDHTIGAWTKRSDANDFAVFLAAELKINAKGVITEKDGRVHRVYIPLAATYWHPSGLGEWRAEYDRVRKAVHSAFQD